MIFKKITEVVDKLNERLNEIKEYPDEDCFISSHFRQFMSRGEYDDNSISLSETYKRLKEINEDENFIRKLKYVLNHYV